MHFKLLMILLTMAALTACGSQDSHHHSETAQVEEVYSIPEMELNNGELWRANIETTDDIFAMIELMDAHSDKENTISYNELAEQLNEAFNGIFRNCTMTGAAHDQLHNYLYPLNEIMEGLRSADLNICKGAYSDLEQHLGLYFDFFE